MPAPVLSLPVRALALACVSLFLAGVGAVASIESSSSSAATKVSSATPTASASPTSTSQTTSPPTTTTTTPSASAVSQAALSASVLLANDLGGYYTSLPADSGPRLAASGCLALLGQQPTAVYRAVQYLRGPFGPDLPDINERLGAYATPAAAATAFADLSRSLSACTSTRLALAGGSAMATLAPITIASLGDQATSAQGPFRLAGLPGQVTVSVVRSATVVMVIVYADKVPASKAILGSAQSTIRAAAGKASP